MFLAQITPLYLALKQRTIISLKEYQEAFINYGNLYARVLTQENESSDQDRN